MKKSNISVQDPVIISRVRQYLEDNVDKTYLDVTVMTKHLQERYPEYSRRKIVPFRSLVEQAYRIVSESYGLNEKLSSEESGSDLEMMDESPNIMSEILNSLYNKNKSATSPKTAETSVAAEAIDISSDEDSNEEQTNGKTKTQTVQPKVTKSNDTDKNSEPALANDKAELSSTTQKRTEEQLIIQAAKKQKIDHKQNQERLPWLQVPKQQNNHKHNDNSSQSSLTSNHRIRKYKKEIKIRKSRENFQDVGGMEKILKELCELLIHIKSPEIYFALGLLPPRGILLHGPSGVGKTLLAHAIAGQLNMGLIEIAATEFIAGVSGESEERIRDVFDQACILSPCVLFIDEIDAISANRNTAQKDMERRIVSQLISSLDGLKQSEDGQSVLVIGATTRVDTLDPSLRRAGRFDHEIPIGIPNRKDRKEILTIICEGISVEPKCDFDKIAELTPGYVGADLLALVSRAATIAVKNKYATQMRQFQAKHQANITIVDLDDDEGEEIDKVAKTTKNKTKTNESDLAVDAEQKKDVPNEKDNEKNKETDTETVKQKENENKNANTAEQDNNNTVSTKKTTTEQMDVDDEVTNKVNETSEQNVEAVNDAEKKLNIPEPSLFELIIWLENPPEEFNCVNGFSIVLDDFLEAIKVVQPSAKREGFITVPDVTWNDIGSLQNIRDELKLAVLAPVKYPEKLETLGLSAPSGVLLCGPPGCGKTLIAKAIANEAGINFISVKGPELMNMYVGESERAVRSCFQRARNSAPCVIFFDEFDSLCPKRSEGNESGSGTRIVNQLLTEMDGVEDRKGVYLLAATNRPDIIDPAILRPGRLDTILYVGLPEEKDRAEILRATTKNRTCPVLDEDVDFAVLAKRTDGFTGADLAGLVRQASMMALKESISNENDSENLCVRNKHFDMALRMLRPSVSEQDRKVYEKLRLKYAAPRTAECEKNN